MSARWASPPNDAPRPHHPRIGCARINRGATFTQVDTPAKRLFRRFVQFVGANQLLVRPWLSAMRSPHGGFGWGVLVKVDERVAFALRFSWSRDAVVRFYGSAGRSKPVRGSGPMMGAGGVVRYAGTRKPAAQKAKAPAAQRVCVAGAVCEVVGSAVTYSPTPSRGQYHRRGRA